VTVAGGNVTVSVTVTWLQASDELHDNLISQFQVLWHLRKAGAEGRLQGR
jgi:hypothetical protein